MFCVRPRLHKISVHTNCISLSHLSSSSSRRRRRKEDDEVERRGMHSGEAAPGGRLLGPSSTGCFWAHVQSHNNHLLLFSTSSSLSRLYLHFSRQLLICRSQSCESGALSPIFKDETDDTNEFSLISSTLLASEREEAKAVLRLFLKKQGMSNALASRTINKSDSFIDYLISKLHATHKSRYMVGRELSTLEIRSALIPYLEALIEERIDLKIDLLENFPAPPGTTNYKKSSSPPTNRTALKSKAIARVTQLDENGNHLPQVSYLLELGIDLSSIEQICTKFPSFTYYSVERKIKPIVNLLLDLGIAEAEIPKIIFKRPQLCGMSLTENIIPTMKYLERVGVDKTQWVKVITGFPALLTCSMHKMKLLVDFISELGVPEENIGKILTRHPRLVSYSVEDKLRPISEYFTSLGINNANLIQKCPQCFGLSIERNLKPINEFFIENGFSHEEFGSMVNRSAPIYTLSLTENLKPKWDYFLEMEYPRSELLQFPHYFLYSLEKRIKPRFERMNFCGVRLGLNMMLSYNSVKFETFLQKKMDKLSMRGDKQ